MHRSRMFRGLVLFVVVFVALAALSTACGAGVPPLTEEGLKNGAYELADIGSFQLKDGSFEKKYGEGATQVYMVTFVKSVVGNLDKDSAVDGAVVLAWTGGGSGSFVQLIAVTNKSGAGKQAAAVSLGDRVQVKNLTIMDKNITVEMLAFGPTDPRCCPSQQVTATYTLQGNAGEEVVLRRTFAYADARVESRCSNW